MTLLDAGHSFRFESGNNSGVVRFSIGDGGVVRRPGAGGHTVVTPYTVSIKCEIVGQTGWTFTGTAYCSMLDRFQVEKGCKYALGRAMKAGGLSRSERLGIWTEFFAQANQMMKAGEGLNKGRLRISEQRRVPVPSPTP